MGSQSPREQSTSNVPALKDTPVYKRALAEDIEPTLRLDIAPGIGWMAKRTIINSMTAGNLVVEPMPSNASKFRGPIFACALCGENRKAEQYLRKHRFRTSEAEDAQRYPLCDYCLGRVRMSCDYIAFLRMVRDGHWRAESEEEINSTWEESVKLRERMFWQRVGGGVVPSYVQSKDSPRSPTFSRTNGIGRASEESQRQPPPLPPRASDDPFKADKPSKRVSIGGTIISPGPNEIMEKRDGILGPEEEKRIEEEAMQQLHNEMRSSMGSKSSGSETVIHEDQTTKTDSSQAGSQDSAFTTPAETPSKEMQRLSLTIPGSFN
jgi:hypothetical protein